MATYTGTPGDDIFYGDGSNDVANGGGGNDTFDGRAGDDKLYGEGGNDRLEGGAGSDIMDGGDGDDTIVFASAADLGSGDQVIGGAGYDTLYVRDDNFGTLDLTGITITGIESLVSQSGPVKITASLFNSLLSFEGLLRLQGSGTFNLTGKTSNGSLYMDSGDDHASLVGNASANTFLLDGGGGNDTLLGSTTIDILIGGEGNDRIEGNGGNDSIAGDGGDDIAYGGAGNDSFWDGLGNDEMYGEAGDDVFEVDIDAGYGAGDLVDGGAGGYDQLWIKGGSPYVDKTIDLGSYRISNIEALDAQWMTIAGSAAQLSQFQLVRAEALRLTSAGTLTIAGDGFQVGTIFLSNAGNTVDATGASSGLKLVGGNGNDTILGGSSVDLLDGGGGNDTLRGGGGNDIIYNSAGADVMEGGAGNDTFVVTTGVEAGDVFRGGADGDGIRIDWPDSSYWEQIYDFSGATLESIEGISGGRVKLTVAQALGMTGGIDVFALHIANGGTLDLRGIDVRGPIYLSDAGNTLLTGQPNYYTRYVYGGAGNDTVTGTDGIDVFEGGGGADRLDGGAGDDTLSGGEGNDVLIDGEGRDALLGGGGDDMFMVATSTTLFDMFDGGDGSNDRVDVRVRGDVVDLSTFLNASRIEGVIANVEVRISGAMMTQLNYVEAQILRVLSAGDVVLLNNGFTGSAIYLSDAGHRVDLAGTTHAVTVTGGTGIDNITGGNAADLIYGGGGNDRLTGGLGADHLHGGTGDDAFYVDRADDIAFENAGEGTDTVFATAGYYLFANLENLTLVAGAGDIFGVGNELANTLVGNEGANLLIAGAGDDVVRGGNGGDSLFGQDGVDQLFGENGIDYLVGGAGNDLLYGGNDADALYGEAGDDQLSGGVDFKTDILVGGDGNDLLLGNSGLGDYDLMDGGVGNDSYYVDTGDDLTFEAAGGGTDTVYANVAGANNGVYLYANVENLVLLGTTTFGVGNELANVMTGNASGNWLLGGAGDDVLNGKAGNDVLFGEGGSDRFVFERGTGGDVIGDFAVGVDKIDLSAFGLTWQTIVNSMHENGGTTAIDLGNGDLIVLNGVASAALTAGDFILTSTASKAVAETDMPHAGFLAGGDLTNGYATIAVPSDGSMFL